MTGKRVSSNATSRSIKLFGAIIPNHSCLNIKSEQSENLQVSSHLCRDQCDQDAFLGLGRLRLARAAAGRHHPPGLPRPARDGRIQEWQAAQCGRRFCRSSDERGGVGGAGCMVDAVIPVSFGASPSATPAYSATLAGASVISGAMIGRLIDLTPSPCRAYSPNRVKPARKRSQFIRAIKFTLISLGHTASHSRCMEQAPKPSRSIAATMLMTRRLRSGWP